MVGNGLSRYLRHGHRNGLADNGRKWVKMGEKKFTAGKWSEMDYRVICAMDIEMA